MKSRLSILLFLGLCSLFGVERQSVTLDDPADWKEAVQDTLDVTRIPEGLIWTTPKKLFDPYARLQSAIPMWAYGSCSGGGAASVFQKNGEFKVTKNRSFWYRRTMEIPAGLLKNNVVYFYAQRISYCSGVFVNGRFVGKSIQNSLPVRFDITRFLKPGKNEILIGGTTREGIIDPETKEWIAPNNGHGIGILPPVRLETRPYTAIDDVFVKTSVSGKKIEFEITLQNKSGFEQTVVPKIVVTPERDSLKTELQLTGDPVKIPARSEKTIHIRKNWIAPVLWSPSSPEIYKANVSLFQQGRKINAFCQTFGFREFTCKGLDFMLNGKRIFLHRKSALSNGRDFDKDPRNFLQEFLSSVNSIRQHLGTYDIPTIYQADRTGMLVIPESAYSWYTNPGTAHVWMPGVKEYFKGWCKLLRNHPSVVIYSLANETYWETKDPEKLKLCREIADTVRKVDPTRPLQADGDNSWGGILDIVNLHYPEGQGGEFRNAYPNAGINAPNDFYHLVPHKPTNGWHANALWDRPLVLGEYTYGLGPGDARSSTFGDLNYDWRKWETMLMGGYGRGNLLFEKNNPQLIGMYCRNVAPRAAGVAGMDCWIGDPGTQIPPIQVAPLEYHPNAFSGEFFQRKIVIFNDKPNPVSHIRYHLTDAEGNLYVNEYFRKVYVPEGRKQEIVLSLPIPRPLTPLKLLLGNLNIIHQEASYFAEA